MVGDGVLSLDQPAADLIAAADWRGLPVVGGDDAVDDVTIGQLLAHRSGLPDYFSEPPTNDGAPTVLHRWLDPRRRRPQNLTPGEAPPLSLKGGPALVAFL